MSNCAQQAPAVPSEHKGRLLGIIDRLPELVEAGVTAVVLNLVSGLCELG